MVSDGVTLSHYAALHVGHRTELVKWLCGEERKRESEAESKVASRS